MAYRAGHLAMILALLKGSKAAESGIIISPVEGDMNAIDRFENKLH